MWHTLQSSLSVLTRPCHIPSPSPRPWIDRVSMPSTVRKQTWWLCLPANRIWRLRRWPFRKMMFMLGKSLFYCLSVRKCIYQSDEKSSWFKRRPRLFRLLTIYSSSQHCKFIKGYSVCIYEFICNASQIYRWLISLFFLLHPWNR